MIPLYTHNRSSTSNYHIKRNENKSKSDLPEEEVYLHFINWMYEKDDPEKQQKFEVIWWCNNCSQYILSAPCSMFQYVANFYKGSVNSDNKKVYFRTYLLILKGSLKGCLQ